MHPIMRHVITLGGLISALWYAWMHPGHDGVVMTILAALWGYIHGGDNSNQRPA